MTPEAKSQEERCETAARIIGEEFRYGLTPAEAVDHLAVEKADIATGKWADIRDVSHSTVSGNVAGARKKINTNRLDAEVSEEDGKVYVRVTDPNGGEHDLKFSKQMSGVHVDEFEATLELVYEEHGDIHGYCLAEDGKEYELTLWHDGGLASSFREFDRRGRWGSPRAKADTVLWERTQD
jgi:hypothetical protein